jgi:outer membrane protein OmpA-like peptidoglycan-associated protein
VEPEPTAPSRQPEPALAALAPAVEPEPASPSQEGTQWEQPFPASFTLNGVWPLALQRARFSALVRQARACPGKLVLTGHSCTLGTQSAQHAVGLSRARSARLLLLKEGLPAERLEVRSRGGQEPIADNHTRAGRQRNRRVAVTCVLPEPR